MNNPAKHIWEVDKAYLCPIVGYCLTHDEQSSIYKKSGMGTELASGKKTPKGIVMHELLVGELAREGNAALRAEHILTKKYRRQLAACADLAFAALYEACVSMLNAEEFGACVWVASSCSGCTRAEYDELYGLVHMYTHSMRDELIRKNMQSRTLEKQNERLAAALSETRQRCKALEKEAAGARRGMEASKTEHAVRMISSAPQADTSARIKELTADIALLRAENARLVREEKRSAEWFSKAHKDMEDFFALVRAAPACGTGCGQGAACNLCEKRVLVVGGLEKLKSFYRDVVAGMNGVFLYHDGHCNNGASGLPELIEQADIVLCPVDVNSHAACLKVKHSCKESGKQYYMLRKSSVSSMYETLRKVSTAC